MKDVKPITPKYLTKNVAQLAVAIALNAVVGKESPLKSFLKRLHFCIVVLVPAMQPDGESDWPDHPIEPHEIYAHAFGNREDWEHPYDNIARGKALQLCSRRNDDRAGNIPHLLFPGDTPHWGGVRREGIVVTCSGVQPWFDRLISGMVADAIVALAHDAYERDEERKSGADFLS